MEILEQLGRQPVLPIINHLKPKNTIQTVEALQNGGVKNLEITLRNDFALSVLKSIRIEFPDLMLGAGTILKEQQIDQLQEIGIHFGVSPVWNQNIWEKAVQNNFFLIPSVLTPSELNRAVNCECRLVKVFPIEPIGGYNYLKALIGPFRHVGLKYLPTGGISQDLVTSYLGDPDVFTVGGSWVTPRNLILNSKFSMITKLAKKVVSFAN